MYDLDKWQDKLLSDIGEKRYKHSFRVMETAVKINKTCDEDEVKTAAILHDCAKKCEDKYLIEFTANINPRENEFKDVLHSFLGAEVAKKVYNINNENVLDAIRFHTTARADMSELDKVIFLADAIEPNRDYPGVDEIRELVKKDFDEAIFYILNHNIEFLISKNALIHPLTIEARNFMIKEKND